MQRRKCLLHLQDAQRMLRRMAHEIWEKNEDMDSLCLVGIAGQSRQAARLLHENLCAVTGCSLPYGEVQLDTGRLLGLDGVQDRTVVLAVDVLFSGESIRQALTVLCAAGRPRCVQLAALVDRGHRRYPIRANFVGKNIPTSMSEYIEVRLLADGQAAGGAGPDGTAAFGQPTGRDDAGQAAGVYILEAPEL